MARMSFPFSGLDKGRTTSDQPTLTSPDLNNVRIYDVLDNRARGGQRPGLKKLYSQQIGGSNQAIVELLSITIVS